MLPSGRSLNDYSIQSSKRVIMKQKILNDIPENKRTTGIVS